MCEPQDAGSLQDWVEGMKNADGTTGAHWTMEQIVALRDSRSITDADPYALFIATNMIYSDYGEVLKKFGVDRPEVCIELARAFLLDPDSKQGMDKLKAYYRHVAH
jgi:hypothetical protein